MGHSINRSFLFLAVLVLLFVGVDQVKATSIILEETYDGLTLGSVVPGWTAPQGGSTPIVQNVSFNSGPHGAEITNDFEVLRSFAPLTGLVTFEIWMDPKVGSDTNNIMSIAFDNELGGTALVGKNDSDRWFYQDGELGSAVFFEDLDGEGHNIKVVYNSVTARFDMFFDRDRDGDFDALDFSVFNVQYGTGNAGRTVTALTLNSGRGGSGTTSYFDDLRVSVDPIPEPSTMLLLGFGLAGLGWYRRRRKRSV